jgi:hypothetical protein
VAHFSVKKPAQFCVQINKPPIAGSSSVYRFGQIGVAGDINAEGIAFTTLRADFRRNAVDKLRIAVSDNNGRAFPRQSLQQSEKPPDRLKAASRLAPALQEGLCGDQQNQ